MLLCLPRIISHYVNIALACFLGLRFLIVGWGRLFGFFYSLVVFDLIVALRKKTNVPPEEGQKNASPKNTAGLAQGGERFVKIPKNLQTLSLFRGADYWVKRFEGLGVGCLWMCVAGGLCSPRKGKRY